MKLRDWVRVRQPIFEAYVRGRWAQLMGEERGTGRKTMSDRDSDRERDKQLDILLKLAGVPASDQLLRYFLAEQPANEGSDARLEWARDALAQGPREVSDRKEFEKECGFGEAILNPFGRSESDPEFRGRIIEAYDGMLWGLFCTEVLESSGTVLDELGKRVGLERRRT